MTGNGSLTEWLRPPSLLLNKKNPNCNADATVCTDFNSVFICTNSCKVTFPLKSDYDRLTPGAHCTVDVRLEMLMCSKKIHFPSQQNFRFFCLISAEQTWGIKYNMTKWQASLLKIPHQILHGPNIFDWFSRLYMCRMWGQAEGQCFITV